MTTAEATLSLPRARTRPQGAWKRVLKALADWRLERRTARELAELSDRALADIGLRRDQVDYVARGYCRR